MRQVRQDTAKTAGTRTSSRARPPAGGREAQRRALPAPAGTRRRATAAAPPRVRRAGRLQALLSAVVVSGAIVAGIVYGGHGPAAADALGAAAGLDLRYVKLTGQKETSDSAVVAALGIHDGSTLLTIDADAARARLESLPWVEEARVRMVLPGALEVAITEGKAFARWSVDGATRIIDRSGRTLSDVAEPRFATLPLLVGEGARDGAVEAVETLAAHARIEARTAALIRINRRRWDLMLDTGTTVKLPEEGIDAALDRLLALEARHAILSRDLSVIDLRLADRTTLRLSPDALGPDGGLPEVERRMEARI